jgi:hypothetical protein
LREGALVKDRQRFCLRTKICFEERGEEKGGPREEKEAQKNKQGLRIKIGRRFKVREAVKFLLMTIFTDFGVARKQPPRLEAGEKFWGKEETTRVLFLGGKWRSEGKEV